MFAAGIVCLQAECKIWPLIVSGYWLAMIQNISRVLQEAEVLHEAEVLQEVGGKEC